MGDLVVHLLTGSHSFLLDYRLISTQNKVVGAPTSYMLCKINDTEKIVNENKLFLKVDLALQNLPIRGFTSSTFTGFN